MGLLGRCTAMEDAWQAQLVVDLLKQADDGRPCTCSNVSVIISMVVVVIIINVALANRNLQGYVQARRTIYRQIDLIPG